MMSIASDGPLLFDHASRSACCWCRCHRPPACVALADWLLLGLPINVWNWPLTDLQIGISLALLLGAFGIVAVACITASRNAAMFRSSW